MQTPRDDNFVPALLATSNVDGVTPVKVYADPTTHRLLTDVAAIANLLQTDIYTSTNLQTTFTPTKTPAYTIYLSINGAIQTPSTDYSLTGGNYVLTNPIPAGNSVVVVYSTS